MKKIILFAALMFPATIFAQFSLEIGGGASTKKYAVAELSAQYTESIFFVQAGYFAQLTRNVDGGTYLNATGGLHLEDGDYFAEAGAGPVQIYRSTDRKNLNKKSILITGAFGKEVNGNDVLVKVGYADNVVLAMLSLRVNF